MSTCNICGAKEKPVWKHGDKMEVLMLLTVAVIRGWVKHRPAMKFLGDPEFHYCPDHIFEAAKQLKILADWKYKQVSGVGLRIIALWAGEVAGEVIKPGSLETIVKNFLWNFLREHESEEIMDLLCDEYGHYEVDDSRDTYICLECGQEIYHEEVRFITRHCDKAAFAVYAGRCVSGTMNCEQAYAATLLEGIPVCKAHMEEHAFYLKKLESALLEEHRAKLFTETLQNTFGWRTPKIRYPWFSTFNYISCYVNSISQPVYDPEKYCDYCNVITERMVVFVDDLMEKKGHWDCFVKKMKEMSVELKEPVDNNGTIEWQVPPMHTLEDRKGKELLSLLHLWGKVIGHKDVDYVKNNEGKRQLNYQRERTRVLIFFAKYMEKAIRKTNDDDDVKFSRDDDYENDEMQEDAPKTPKTPVPSKPSSVGLRACLLELGLSCDFPETPY